MCETNYWDTMIRSFIAIDVHDTMRIEFQQIESHFRSFNEDIRWVRPENLHLTLKFLGDIPESIVEEKSEVLAEKISAFPPVKWHLTVNGCFPRKGNPRVFFTGIEMQNDTLEQISRLLDDVFKGTIDKSIRNDFHPHITLGRTKSTVSQNFLTEFLNYSVTAHEQTTYSVNWVQTRFIDRRTHYYPLKTYKMNREERSNYGR